MNIEGVILTDQKTVSHPLGDIRRIIKATDSGFQGFAECYLTSIHSGLTKGWKKHTRMFLNLVVVHGKVQFVLKDDRPQSATFQKMQSFTLTFDGPFQRLTVPPGIWMAFKGLDVSTSTVMNFTQIEHDPQEAINIDLKDIVYDWNN